MRHFPYVRYLLVALTFLLCRGASADTLLVAGGAGYKRPIAELSAAFEKKTGHKVEQIYGHMAAVLSQAKQSGQVAVVFGDLSYLEKAEGISFAGFLPLGDGRLVVGWRKDMVMKSVDELVEPRFARIAMPDTKAAIYGIAAAEFLQRSGLESRVKDRLRVVATVPQVSAYLLTGEVDAGLFNLTEALAIKEKLGGHIEIDRKLYSPIRIVAGVVKGFEDQVALKSLREFLATAEAKGILDKHGL